MIIELLFKAMKSHGRLHQLPSSKRHVVECLVWASVLATVASQALYREVRRRVASDRHMPLLRWATLFGQSAEDLLRLLLSPRDRDFERVVAGLVAEAPDPNRRRKDRALNAVPQAIGA